MKKVMFYRLKVSGIIIVLTILLIQLVKYSKSFYNAFHVVSKRLINIVANITSFANVAVWQYLVFFLIGLFILGLIRVIFKKDKLLSFITKVVLTISVLASFMTITFFSNNYQSSLAEQLQEPIEEYSIEELYLATEYYLQQAQKYVYEIKRDKDGTPIKDDFTELAKIAGASYANLDNEVFLGNMCQVKEVNILGDYLLFNGISGIFLPLTCEASVPSNIDNISICFTMVHEVAHRLTIASEQDANYAAFLACINNEDNRFVYSGYYMAFRYCFNSLRSFDNQKANELVEKYKEDTNTKRVLLDYNYYAEYYQKYKSKLSEISDKLNDAYLKVFNQKDGVLSYSNVTDNLVMYYLNVQ